MTRRVMIASFLVIRGQHASRLSEHSLSLLLLHTRYYEVRAMRDMPAQVHDT